MEESLVFMFGIRGVIWESYFVGSRYFYKIEIKGGVGDRKSGVGRKVGILIKFIGFERVKCY